mmetsp:Transcript_11256/g.37031  ORF Transcript_11256/g.37031 Transcript_11256/m.37031 type:complete len:118 (+) Transcript_11256:459-812(+)
MPAGVSMLGRRRAILLRVAQCIFLQGNQRMILLVTFNYRLAMPSVQVPEELVSLSALVKRVMVAIYLCKLVSPPLGTVSEATCSSRAENRHAAAADSSMLRVVPAKAMTQKQTQAGR